MNNACFQHTNQTAFVLSPDQHSAFVRLLDTHVRPSLAKDVSSYAPGRTRCWLRWEGPLSQSQDYRPGLVVPPLWRAITSCWQTAALAGVPDLALAIHGPIGIQPHRDASYAASVALSINLGPMEWGWSPDRQSNDDQDLVWLPMTGGEVTVFDCKHRHAARQVAADRWGIIAWQTKPHPLPDPGP